ncbi:hypothetical protein PV327_007382 [Microctonus hyperodae]|nr:hypothetical protein PV327_007382 [Microctonus hyperodae]
MNEPFKPATNMSPQQQQQPQQQQNNVGQNQQSIQPPRLKPILKPSAPVAPQNNPVQITSPMALSPVPASAPSSVKSDDVDKDEEIPLEAKELPKWKRPKVPGKWTESLLAAQALIFFVAGFETSSKTISTTLYELAIHPEIQEKLRIEIINILNIHNGKLSYDAINEMKYLDMVMKETLRKYPPASELNRRNIVPYEIPGYDVILPTGSDIHIPIYCIHNDEVHYPNPELFDPERFNEENDNKLDSMTYMPFGAGPRRCIGLKLATYQIKLGLIAVLKNFKVTPSTLTKIPFKIDKSNLVLSAENGIHLEFKSLI